MLLIARKVGESFFIGKNLESKIKILNLSHRTITLGITSPDSHQILREELVLKKSKQKKNKKKRNRYRLIELN